MRHRWIWAYWISPFAYAMRAMVINEMTSSSWTYNDGSAPPGSTVGLAALDSFGFQTQRYAQLPLPFCSNALALPCLDVLLQ